MKTKDQTLLEEAYGLVCEYNYKALLKANPRKIDVKSVARTLSQETGLNETLVYLDLVRTVDAWFTQSDWDYGSQPIDRFNPKETWRCVMILASIKDEKEIKKSTGNVDTDAVLLYRAAKLPLNTYSNIAKVLQKTEQNTLLKYKKAASRFWNEHYALTD